MRIELRDTARLPADWAATPESLRDRVVLIVGAAGALQGPIDRAQARKHPIHGLGADRHDDRRADVGGDSEAAGSVVTLNTP